MAPRLTLYWRPGCPFCTSLSTSLARLGVPFREVDVWEDPEASTFVRSITGGHETVPTVVVGDVPLVNPTVHDIMAVAASEAPELVPDDYEPPQPSRFGRWLRDKLGAAGA